MKARHGMGIHGAGSLGSARGEAQRGLAIPLGIVHGVKEIIHGGAEHAEAIGEAVIHGLRWVWMVWMVLRIGDSRISGCACGTPTREGVRDVAERCKCLKNNGLRRCERRLRGSKASLRHTERPLRGSETPLRRGKTRLGADEGRLRGGEAALHGSEVPLRRSERPLRHREGPLRASEGALHGSAIPLPAPERGNRADAASDHAARGRALCASPLEFPDFRKSLSCE